MLQFSLHQEISISLIQIEAASKSQASHFKTTVVAVVALKTDFTAIGTLLAIESPISVCQQFPVIFECVMPWPSLQINCC